MFHIFYQQHLSNTPTDAAGRLMKIFFLISDTSSSVSDVSPTESNNILDTKDIVQDSTMADVTEVNGSGSEEASDLKPSFIVCH